MPPRRVRRARAARGARPTPFASGPGRAGRHRRRPARWRRACCSTGSPRTCTRATPRSPSGGPRRWRSTATCCATCSAPRSCASCSTRACSPMSSSSCSASPRGAGHGRPTSSTTCSARSATSPPPRSTCVAKATLVRRGSTSWSPTRRAIELAVGGETRYAAAEDAARYRDGLGCCAPARAADGVHRAGRAPARRARRPVRSHARAVPRRRRGTPARHLRRAGRRRDRGARRRRPRGAGRVPSGGRAARVVRHRRAAPAATAIAGHAATRGRAGRTVAPTPASSPRGTASPPIGAGRRRWSRRSACCQGARDRRLDARAPTCCRRGCAATGRRCSTSCARRARSSGSAPGRSARRTAGSGCASPTSSPLLAPGWEPLDAPTGQLHDAIRAAARRHAAPASGAQLRERGAGRHRCRAARRTVGPRVGGRGHQRLAGAAARRARRRRAAKPGARAGAATAWAPRPGRLARIGPPAGAGRWSLVAPLLRAGADRRPRPPTPGAAALERYGVVTREAVLAEGVAGGFAGVYGVLKVLEERGQVRRGYFVDGLGAAQFALPGAVDRLRSARERLTRRSIRNRAGAVRARRHRPGPAVRRRARLARDGGPPGARPPRPPWCSRAGIPLVWFDRRSHHLVTFPATTRDPSWADALAELVKDGRAAQRRGAQGRRRAGGRRDRRRSARRRLRRRLPRARRPRLRSERVRVRPPTFDRRLGGKFSKLLRPTPQLRTPHASSVSWQRPPRTTVAKCVESSLSI